MYLILSIYYIKTLVKVTGESRMYPWKREERSSLIGRTRDRGEETEERLVGTQDMDEKSFRNVFFLLLLGNDAL